MDDRFRVATTIVAQDGPAIGFETPGWGKEHPLYLHGKRAFQKRTEWLTAITCFTYPTLSCVVGLEQVVCEPKTTRNFASGFGEQ